MRRRWMSAILALTMALALTACGGDSSSSSNNDSPTQHPDNRHCPDTSAVAPFPLHGCAGLVESTDGYRASIKRFNFDCILAPLFAIVNHFSKFLVSLAGVGKKRMLYRLIYGMLSQ